MMDILSYGASERVSVIAATPAASTTKQHSRLVRVIGTASVFFAVNEEANDTSSPYLPYNAEIFLSLSVGDTLSFVAEASTTGEQYVYITEVNKVL